MTKTPKHPRDPNQLAKLIVEIAAGNAQDAPQVSDPNPMASLGRAGGNRGAMMKLLCGVALGCVAFSLQGCVQPEIESANERGVILKYANGTNEAAAFKMADSYCHEHGRVAQISGTDVLYNHIVFACVTP
jgi:hypothetical protein